MKRHEPDSHAVYPPRADHRHWRLLRYRFWHAVRRATFRVWCYAWLREAALDRRTVQYGE